MANHRKSQKKQLVNLNVRKPQELVYLLSQLDVFAEVVSCGYSENNWIIATDIYKGLQGHLLPGDRETLMELMREAYVCRDQSKTLSEISLLKERLSEGT